MSLRAKAPEEVKISKPKFMISGEAKVGKTMFALQFPKPYFIDTEGGAVLPQYTDALKKSGGKYLGKPESQDFSIIIEQVKELSTTKHEFKTLILDSFTWLYLLEAAAAEESGGSEYGRDKKEANKPTRQLIRALEKLDMTVIIVCHSKDKWEKVGKERINTGSTFDGWEKLSYVYDLWIEILRGGKTMIVKGSRMAPFPEGSTYPATYEKFSELYGRDILEKESTPIVFANHAQLTQMEQLIEVLNISQEAQDKVLKSFNADNFEELTEEEMQKCIEGLQKKIKNLTTDTKNGVKNEKNSKTA